ncbi:hypothetical protein QE400_000085 [Xanthomonas sacchari]|uniref:hypothetical protein n=1 Tax=Xanthomonas sacchari TaxID=56458 RepID=UPI00277EBF6D|nr:hypothetical protein [Xanthomonas sacchari]MDQ1090672.1 hypothetical protein [Xanthomonas sacchari]
MRYALLLFGLAAAIVGPARAAEHIALHVKVTNGDTVLMDGILNTLAGEEAHSRVGTEIGYVKSVKTFARANSAIALEAQPPERTYDKVFDGVEISVTPGLTGTDAANKVLLHTRVSVSRLKKMDHAGQGDIRIDLPDVQSLRAQTDAAVAWGTPQVITSKGTGKDGDEDYRIEVTPRRSQAN